jgi:hypothetical protein
MIKGVLIVRHVYGTIRSIDPFVAVIIVTTALFYFCALLWALTAIARLAWRPYRPIDRKRSG